MEPTLRLRSHGQAVQDLCKRLVEFGYLYADMKNHMVFDHAVRAAVLSFQARHLDPRGMPLKVDGVVGPLTWWALEHPDVGDMFPTKGVQEAPADVDCAYIGARALLVALREVNAGACEQGANNSGPDVEKYIHGLVPTPANWCAAAVSWCIYEATGGDMPFEYTLGARDLRNQFKKRGWLVKPPLIPGDIVFWWRGQPNGWMGHVGFVKDIQNGILYTAEGNKGPFPSRFSVYNYVFARMEKVLGFGRLPKVA